jgi:hypothetical protein
LDHRGFAPNGQKTGLGFPWISLDSLVRIETFQWFTRDFPQEKFIAPFAARWRAGTGADMPTMQKRGVAHRARLTRFLLFCNQLAATEISNLARAEGGAPAISLIPKSTGNR